METNRGRAAVLVALGLCVGSLTGCPASDQCEKCGLACEVLATTPVAWTEQTALGSPEQLFASFAGSCQAPFQWDASGWGSTLTIVPVQGQSTLTATVTLDTASARLLTHTTGGCPDVLQIDGTATLDLPEGKVADQQPFTIGASAGLIPSTLGFVLKEESFGPWVSIQKSDPSATLSMSVTVSPPGLACSGQIGLGTQTIKGNVGSGSGGPLGSWSDTGCGAGQVGVDPAQPWQGIDVAAAIATTFGQATLSGTWSDGSATTLVLTTATLATAACAESLANGFTVVTVPVDVVATSADGRVQGLSGRGSVRVSVNQSSLRDLQLNLSTDLVCASEADTLPYAGASCAIDGQVTAQLHFNHYTDDRAMDAGSLELYVFERQNPSPGIGGADRVDSLILGP